MVIGLTEGTRAKFRHPNFIPKAPRPFIINPSFKTSPLPRRSFTNEHDYSRDPHDIHRTLRAQVGG